MSSELCSLSTVIPNICTLQRFLSKIDQKDDTVQITKQLIESLNKRFFSHDNLSITNDERYVLPTIIDPRYKLKFLPVDKREQARSMLLDAVVKNQINIDFVFYFILEYDLNKLVFTKYIYIRKK